MFKQLSNRVSAKTIEETYTENDVEHVVVDGKETSDISAGYNSNTGFTFDYPMRWLNDQSDFKAIGIRRLEVVPTSHVFALNITFTWVPQNGGSGNRTYPIQITIQSSNTFEEIINYIVNTLNEFIVSLNIATGLGFTYDYDYRTGNFTLTLEKGNANSASYKIEGIGKNTEVRKQYLDFFLKFLNQDCSDANRNILKNASESKTFTNVWDRKSLHFHASFSDNRRGFIGLNEDFYDNPSIFYDPPTNSSNFWIRFTTDGVHQILPRYCRFYIGLCFVRNYKNSLVTK